MAGIITPPATPSPGTRFSGNNGMMEAFQQLVSSQLQPTWPGQVLNRPMQMPPTSSTIPPIFQPVGLGGGQTFQLHAAPTRDTMSLIRQGLMPPQLLGVPLDQLAARGVTGLPVLPTLPPTPVASGTAPSGASGGSGGSANPVLGSPNSGLPPPEFSGSDERMVTYYQTTYGMTPEQARQYVQMLKIEPWNTTPPPRPAG